MDHQKLRKLKLRKNTPKVDISLFAIEDLLQMDFGYIESSSEYEKHYKDLNDLQRALTSETNVKLYTRQQLSNLQLRIDDRIEELMSFRNEQHF